MLLANFNRKEHWRHRAVSLRQHGFLVIIIITAVQSRFAETRFAETLTLTLTITLTLTLTLTLNPNRNFNHKP